MQKKDIQHSSTWHLPIIPHQHLTLHLQRPSLLLPFDLLRQICSVASLEVAGKVAGNTSVAAAEYTSVDRKELVASLVVGDKELVLFRGEERIQRGKRGEKGKGGIRAYVDTLQTAAAEADYNLGLAL